MKDATTGCIKLDILEMFHKLNLLLNIFLGMSCIETGTLRMLCLSFYIAIIRSIGVMQ